MAEPVKPWEYAPRLALQRDNRRRIDALAKDTAPLVAAGDPLSLSRARQKAEQAADPDRKSPWLSKFADTFRSIVPQEVRDVVGTGLQASISGERFLDLVLPGDPGTAAGEFIGKAPVVGGLARRAFDIGLSPLTLATAGGGGAAAGALRGAAAVGGVRGAFAKGLGATLEPVLRGNVGQRIAGETLLGLGAEAGATAAGKLTENAPLPVRLGAQIAAGLGGGIAGARLAGGLVHGGVPGRVAATAAPNEIAPVAPNKLGELFGMREVPPELSQGDRVQNVMRETMGMPTLQEKVTPFMRERTRLLEQGGIVDSYANQTGLVADVSLTQAFDMDGVVVPSLAEVQGFAPSISDIAAKMPLYEPLLSPQQAAAMREIEGELRPLFDALAEQGIEIGSRPDIIEGGFYIPRGAADLPGGEPSIRFGGGGRAGSRKGFEKTSTFETQAQGVEAGYEYQSPGQAITDYVRQAGERAVDARTGNYFKALTDEGGNTIATTAADRIDPNLRSQVEVLRAKIAGRGQTIRNQAARLTPQEQAAREAERVAGGLDRLALSAETRAILRKASIEEIDISSPQMVRRWVPDVDTLATRADSLRARVAREPGNRGAARQLGETEALLDLRRAADGAGESLDDMLVAVDDAAERASRYTSEVRLSRGERGTGNRAPAFGTRERARWDADRRQRGISGGRRRAAQETVEPPPFDGPIDAVRAYEDTLTRVLGNESIDISATASTDAVIRAAERELAILRREARKAGRRAATAGERVARTSEAQQGTIAEATRLRDELAGLRGRWESAKSKAAQMPRGTGGIDMTSLQGYAFPERIAAAANMALEKGRPLAGRGAGPQKAITAMNRLMRMMNATLDVSFMGIQGLLGAVTDPQGYGQAMKVAYQTMRDPQALGSYLRTKDPAFLKQAVRDGVRLSNNVTEFTSTQRGFGRFSDLLEDADWVKGQNPVRGANRMFGTFGDVMRVELYEALTDVAKASGLDMADGAVRASVANAANLMTGTGTRSFLGDEIGGLVTFAPRFFQAQLDLAGKTLTSGGLEGQLARRTFTRLLGAAVGLTVAGNAALGEETDFDPSSPNFMRLRVADSDVSILGPWDSLLRGAMRTAEGDATYILRSKASPALRTAWDLLSGKDGIRQDTRTPGYVAKMFAPFSWQGAFDESPVQTLIAQTGVKAAPLSPTDRFDALARMQYGAKFYDLEPQFRRQLQDDNPELWQESVRRGNEPRQRAEAARVELLEQQEADDELLLSGSLTREDWKKERDRRRIELNARRDEIYPKDTVSRDPTLAAYFAIIDEATDPRTGRVDWDTVDIRRSSELTEEQQRYIDENTGFGTTDLDRLYREAANEYYELPRYRGFTSSEAVQIDRLWQEARNLARSTDDADMLRALRKVSQDADPRVVGGVRRRIVGLLKETGEREKWRKRNAAAPLVSGAGTLTPREREALLAATS